jgi:heat shock protein HtpX
MARYREYSDDSKGAIMTGKPSSLVNALLKFSGKMKKIFVKDFEDERKLNAFYNIPALSGCFLASLLSTDPPVEIRALKLKDMLNRT